MRYKTYECDHHGRITIYPSLERPSKKQSELFNRLLKRLLRSRKQRTPEHV